jgi:lysophospholipase L1-like esterase
MKKLFIHLCLFPLALCLFSPPLCAEDPMPAFKQGGRILFQGDSITDGNRGRSPDPNHILGHGYVFLISASFGAALPERKLAFLNRGVSGNTAGDLSKRWLNDTIKLKPDIVSILIGVNDHSAGLSVEEFEKTYDWMLGKAAAALPGVRFVLCEPFTLPTGKYKENFGPWQDGLKKRAEAVERLAAKYKAPVVRFQKAFDDGCKRAPAEYWIWDGIHPTYAGHQIMADEWVRTVREFYR